MTTRELQDELRDLIKAVIETRDDEDPVIVVGDQAEAFRRVDTYEEVGVLTTDPGLVITTDDGTEFQVTIVQSR